MSRFLNSFRALPGGAILAAVDSGGTQCATEVNGNAVSTTWVGLRFRHCSAVVSIDQSAGTSHKFGFRGNWQYRIATSGTGSTYADFGSTMSYLDNTVSGQSSGAGQYVYQTAYEVIPARSVQIRLQYTPKGFIATSEAVSSATGGVADIAPVVVLTDPNRLPADTAATG